MKTFSPITKMVKFKIYITIRVHLFLTLKFCTIIIRKTLNIFNKNQI